MLWEECCAGAQPGPMLKGNLNNYNNKKVLANTTTFYNVGQKHLRLKQNQLLQLLLLYLLMLGRFVCGLRLNATCKTNVASSPSRFHFKNRVKVNRFEPPQGFLLASWRYLMALWLCEWINELMSEWVNESMNNDDDDDDDDNNYEWWQNLKPTFSIKFCSRL